MEWQNIKIQQNFLISTTIIRVFSLLIGIVGIVNLNVINDNTNRMEKYYLPVVNNSYKIDKLWQGVIHNLENYNFTGSDHLAIKLSLDRTKDFNINLNKNERDDDEFEKFWWKSIQ